MTTEAQALLQNVARRYLQLQSYRDRGEVVTRFLGPRGHTNTKPFGTLFRRPNRLRFEFQDRSVVPSSPWKQYQIVWRGGKAETYWTVRGFREAESLGLAIAGATGVSSRSAHIVPRLLLPSEVGGRSVLETGAAQLLGRDLLRGRAHFRVLTSDTATEREIVWIDADSFVISQIDEWRHSEGGPVMDQERFERLTPDQRDLVRRSGALERVVEPYETETTTTYQCWLDEDIDDHDFVLDLPDP